MSTVQRYFIFSLFFYINYITRKIIVYIFFCSLSNIVYYINLNYSRASFLSFLDKYNLFIFFFRFGVISGPFHIHTIDSKICFNEKFNERCNKIYLNCINFFQEGRKINKIVSKNFQY